MATRESPRSIPRLLMRVLVVGTAAAHVVQAAFIPPCLASWMAAPRGRLAAVGSGPEGDAGLPPALNVDALGEDIYDRTRPPPLLITIGPQCGGKTSLLRRLNATRPSGAPLLLDVAIDDDRDVYRRVPMRAFLEGELEGPKDVQIRGRLASDRCRDPAPEECRVVLGFLTGLWSLQEAERQLAALSSTVDVLPALLASLPRAAEAFQASCRVQAKGRGGEDGGGSDMVHAMGARFYSLFVPEAIPRAVKASNQRLSAALRDHLGPVAWGNTNSKAGDFKGALRAAEVYGRRAILLRWGLELDRVPLEELLVRNALRATRLGRYIPAVSIKMALERAEGLLSRSGGGHPKALLNMAGFTADPLGRPRSNVLPPEEAEPLIRPFMGLDPRRGQGVARAAAAAESGAAPALVGACTDTATWGGRAPRPPSSSSPSLADSRAGRGGSVWDAGAGDNFILATGVGGVGAGLALGSSGRAAGAEAATRALFVDGIRRVSRAMEQLTRAAAALGPLLVLRMGEWSKFKYWSKAAADMDWEWRRDYQRARNQTLKDREEMIRLNGTDPWAVRDRMFDMDLWIILRTLSGQSGINNKF